MNLYGWHYYQFFRDDCVDQLAFQIFDFKDLQTNQSLFVTIMTTIIKKKKIIIKLLLKISLSKVLIHLQKFQS